MRTASAPVSAASPAPLSSAARRSGLGDEVDRLERRLAPVDAVAQLAGADEHRRAGIDHDAPPASHDELDWLVNSRERRVAHLQSAASTCSCSAPPTSAARRWRRSCCATTSTQRGRRRHGLLGRAATGRAPATDRRRRGHGRPRARPRATTAAASSTADMLARADLVIGMAREHVREAAVARRRARCAKTFTLKELVRRGPTRSGRAAPDEPLAAWLGAVAGAASPRTRCSAWATTTIDVADPIGRPGADYEDTADRARRPARPARRRWPVPARDRDAEERTA